MKQKTVLQKTGSNSNMQKKKQKRKNKNQLLIPCRLKPPLAWRASDQERSSLTFNKRSQKP